MARAPALQVRELSLQPVGRWTGIGIGTRDQRRRAGPRPAAARRPRPSPAAARRPAPGRDRAASSARSPSSSAAASRHLPRCRLAGVERPRSSRTLARARSARPARSGRRRSGASSSRAGTTTTPFSVHGAPSAISRGPARSPRRRSWASTPTTRPSRPYQAVKAPSAPRSNRRLVIAVAPGGVLQRVGRRSSTRSRARRSSSPPDRRRSVRPRRPGRGRRPNARPAAGDRRWRSRPRRRHRRRARRRAGPHLGVGGDRAAVQAQAGRRAQLHPCSDTRGHDHDRAAGPRRLRSPRPGRSPRSIASTSAPSASSTPASRSQRGSPPRPPRRGGRHWATVRRRPASRGDRAWRSEAAISQPMKPEPITTTGRRLQAALAARASGRESAGPRTPGSSAPGTGQALRFGAGGEHAARGSSSSRPPDRVTRRACRIERHRAAARRAARVLGEPALVLQRKLLLGHLAAQQLLGQRWAVVRDAVLVGDDRHRSGAAGLAVGAGGGEPGGSAADDQQPEARAHRRSSTSRR